MWTRLDVWQRIEAVRKRPIRSLVIVASGTTLFVAIAVFASVNGAAAAPGWWLLAGIFLFLDAMALFAFVMFRRQQRRATEGK